MINIINFAGYSGKCYWVDGDLVAGKWQYSDSHRRTINDTTYWDVGEPNNANGECLVINENQKLQVLTCDQICRYICEQKK